MMTGAVAPHRFPLTPDRESFWYLVHAEWTKFRTVRGWVIAAGVTIVAIAAFTFIGAGGSSSSCSGAGGGSACPAQPTGPGGVPVVDAFYFAHQPVTGNGTITVQVTSLTGQAPVAPAGSVSDGPQAGPGGLDPWSKAGIIIKENTSQGSAYAAISTHVCRTISNRDKTRALDHMTQLLKGCPPEECESVAEAIVKVADSLFPQPPPILADRSPRHRGRGESAGRMWIVLPARLPRS